MISLVSKLALWQTNAAQTRPAETGITNLRSKGYFEIALQLWNLEYSSLLYESLWDLPIDSRELSYNHRTVFCIYKILIIWRALSIMKNLTKNQNSSKNLFACYHVKPEASKRCGKHLSICYIEGAGKFSLCLPVHLY